MVLLRVMGAAVLEAPNGRLTASSSRVFSVGVVLILDQDHEWERDELVSLIWPDAPLTNGRHNLRQALYRLRSLGVPVRIEAERVSLSTEASARTDEPLATESTDVLSDAIVSGSRKIGQFLGGFDPTFSPALREWVETQRTLAHARLRILLARCLARVRLMARYSAMEQIATLLLRF